MTEPRKATDVLLDVESKVSMLLDIIRAQDLNIKILSNKLNDVIGRLDKQQAGPPRVVVEAVQAPLPAAPAMPPAFAQMPAGDPEKSIPILAESKLPQDSAPQGFRRSSRPETYAGDNSYLPHAEPKMPVQLPKMPPGRQGANVPPPGRTEASAPPVAVTSRGAVPTSPAFAPPSHQAPPQESQPAQPSPHGQIPVMQRCVDKNGKSIFLADVEITDLSTSQIIFKTRTNGTGKWMASLGIGTYRVAIRKRESLSKEKIEAVQDIQVDGTQSPLELPMMIIK